MSEINVTPFVDVMLVLLIIFMVAAPLMTVGVPLELPKTAAKAVPTEQEEPLTISIQLDGTVSMMNTPVPEDELVALVLGIAQERSSDKIFLRADGGIEYARVVQVMGALNGADFPTSFWSRMRAGRAWMRAPGPQATRAASAMDRPERIGTTISAVGHTGLIVWLLVAGALFRADPSEPVSTAEVTIMSEAEYQALAEAANAARPPVVEPEPEPEAPAPDVPPEPAAPEQPAPEPEPQPEPEPAQPAPVIPDAPVAPLAPPVEEPSPVIATETSPRPRPRDAPEVAAMPSEEPPPDAPEDVETVSDYPRGSAESRSRCRSRRRRPPPRQTPRQRSSPKPRKPLTSPETSAPLTSGRPKARPAAPAPTPEEPLQPETVTAPETPAAPASDPIADALREALEGGTGEAEAGTGTAASGPPMSAGEKDALMVSIKGCWNVGALSTEALRTIVTVSVSMTPDGRPDAGTIRMTGFEGGSEAAAKQAYEAGRRAVLLCGVEGFDLPPEKYDHWRELELVFNPAKMGLR